MADHFCDWSHLLLNIGILSLPVLFVFKPFNPITVGAQELIPKSLWRRTLGKFCVQCLNANYFPFSSTVAGNMVNLKRPLIREPATAALAPQGRVSLSFSFHTPSEGSLSVRYRQRPPFQSGEILASILRVVSFGTISMSASCTQRNRQAAFDCENRSASCACHVAIVP